MIAVSVFISPKIPFALITDTYPSPSARLADMLNYIPLTLTEDNSPAPFGVRGLFCFDGLKNTVSRRQSPVFSLNSDRPFL